MTCAPASAAIRDDGVSAYERLRALAVERAAGGGGAAPALLLLLGQGVPAWMARRSLCIGPPLPAPAAEPRHLDQRQSDLVRLFADMILAADQRRP